MLHGSRLLKRAWKPRSQLALLVRAVIMALPTDYGMNWAINGAYLLACAFFLLLIYLVLLFCTYPSTPKARWAEPSGRIRSLLYLRHLESNTWQMQIGDCLSPAQAAILSYKMISIHSSRVLLLEVHPMGNSEATGYCHY